MRTNPTADQLGFSSGQFEIFLEYDDAAIENSSFIFLPNNALNQQPGTNKVTITLFNAIKNKIFLFIVFRWSCELLCIFGRHDFSRF